MAYELNDDKTKAPVEQNFDDNPRPRNNRYIETMLITSDPIFEERAIGVSGSVLQMFGRIKYKWAAGRSEMYPFQFNPGYRPLTRVQFPVYDWSNHKVVGMGIVFLSGDVRIYFSGSLNGADAAFGFNFVRDF
jgi:hypothetical protein